MHYSGSPLAVDFGEQENAQRRLPGRGDPGTPARVTDIPYRRPPAAHGARHRRGTRCPAGWFGEDYLRVWVREPARAGLREEVAGILPNALEVRIDPEFAAPGAGRPRGRGRRDADAGQLFADYCAADGVADARVAALFAELHDEVTGSMAS